MSFTTPASSQSMDGESICSEQAIDECHPALVLSEQALEHLGLQKHFKEDGFSTETQHEKGSLRAGRAAHNVLHRVAFLTGLGPGDVLLDVGHGDGFPPLGLAHMTGCFAVGIELVPVRFGHSVALARRMRHEVCARAGLPISTPPADDIPPSPWLCLPPGLPHQVAQRVSSIESAQVAMYERWLPGIQALLLSGAVPHVVSANAKRRQRVVSLAKARTHALHIAWQFRLRTSCVPQHVRLGSEAGAAGGAANRPSAPAQNASPKDGDRQSPAAARDAVRAPAILVDSATPVVRRRPTRGTLAPVHPVERKRTVGRQFHAPVERALQQRLAAHSLVPLYRSTAQGAPLGAFSDSDEEGVAEGAPPSQDVDAYSRRWQRWTMLTEREFWAGQSSHRLPALPGMTTPASEPSTPQQSASDSSVGNGTKHSFGGLLLMPPLRERTAPRKSKERHGAVGSGAAWPNPAAHSSEVVSSRPRHPPPPLSAPPPVPAWPLTPLSDHEPWEFAFPTRTSAPDCCESLPATLLLRGLPSLQRGSAEWEAAQLALQTATRPLHERVALLNGNALLDGPGDLHPSILGVCRVVFCNNYNSFWTQDRFQSKLFLKLTRFMRRGSCLVSCTQFLGRRSAEGIVVDRMLDAGDNERYTTANLAVMVHGGKPACGWQCVDHALALQQWKEGALPATEARVRAALAAADAEGGVEELTELAHAVCEQVWLAGSASPEFAEIRRRAGGWKRGDVEEPWQHQVGQPSRLPSRSVLRMHRGLKRRRTPLKT